MLPHPPMLGAGEGRQEGERRMHGGTSGNDETDLSRRNGASVKRTLKRFLLPRGLRPVSVSIRADLALPISLNRQNPPSAQLFTPKIPLIPFCFQAERG